MKSWSQDDDPQRKEDVDTDEPLERTGARLHEAVIDERTMRDGDAGVAEQLDGLRRVHAGARALPPARALHRRARRRSDGGHAPATRPP